MRKLFYLFIVAMCATMFTACSDDDKDPLDDDGEGKEGVITMTIEETDIQWLGVETFNEGEIITIDWGDGTVEELKSFEYPDRDENGEDEIRYVIGNDEDYEDGIRHVYSNDKLYTITIKGKIKALFTGEGDYISSLDVSKCTALTDLDCGGNNLTSLDVSKNTALTQLSCYGNNLTSLDVSKNTALTRLYCGGNNLTSLDISKNTALIRLSCSSNNLTLLNVSGCTALTELECWDNNLTSLDVSGCTALTRLDCRSNNLTSLNVSGCTALEYLVGSDNNLTSSALNQIFRDLPQVTVGIIFIKNNLGADTCDKSIAENKGWDVYYW